MSAVALPAAVDEALESGDPLADSRAFRRCLGQYPTGVAVITARSGERLLGMAVNSFAAVSLDPPLVLWSVRRESSSAAAFREASHSAVSVLASDQVQLSQWFGSGHPERFALAPWTPDANGSPLLAGAIAHLQCRNEAVLDGGDHLVLVLRVEHFSRHPGEPLLFAQGQYAVTQAHPSLPAAAGGAGPASNDESLPLLTLLSMASQRMSMQFQTHRQALGLNASSTRILKSLSGGPRAAGALEQETFLGPDAVEDALAELVMQGHVRGTAAGMCELTPSGQAINAAVAARSAAFTQEKLRGIPPADIEAAKRVLSALRAR